MTTQPQSKGKKKNKDQMRLPLEEFNSIDAPHGHSVVSLKKTGLDWAAAMATHDQQEEAERQFIVPSSTRAQRGPQYSMEDLPTEPPFKASVFNLPVSAEDKEIERFFSPLQIVEINSTKASSTLEFQSQQDLFEALTKDGSTMKGRTINVCLFGQTPQNNYNSDRYGGRGGGYSGYGDRYGSDRNQGSFGGQRTNDRYGDRGAGGGFNRGGDRDGGYSRSSAFGRGGYGQPRSGGYGEGFSERGNYREANRGSYTSGGGEPTSDESTNWRAAARPISKPSPPSSDYNGSRQTYTQSRREPTSYNQTQSYSQPPHHHQNQQDHFYQPSQRGHPQQQHQHHSHYNNPQDQAPYSQSNHMNVNRPQAAPAEERPKLVLQKRKVPLNENEDSLTRNENIFGKAKPSSKPYEKLMEVEQKLSSVQISDKKDAPATKNANPPSGPQANSSNRATGTQDNQSPPSRQQQQQTDEVAPVQLRPPPIQPQPQASKQQAQSDQ